MVLYGSSPNSIRMLQSEGIQGHGVFLSDSFVMLSGAFSWESYLEQWLRYVALELGWQLVMAVLPGGTIMSGSYDVAMDILEVVLPRVSFIVTISMGNDIYPWCFYKDAFQWPCMFDLEDYLHKLIYRVSFYAPVHRWVYGGTSALWRYRKQSQEHSQQYDALASHFVQAIRDTGAACIQGAAIFDDVVIADKVGHISAESQRQFLDGMCILLRWAAISEGQRKDMLQRLKLRCRRLARPFIRSRL